MLLMHGLSYGPALTRNTKERASVCQSDQVGLKPPRVTSHPILTRTIFSSACLLFRTVVPNIIVSHIQRIGCQPEKTTFLHGGGQSRSWSAEQGKKRKSGSARPPPALLVRRKIYIYITLSIRMMSRCYAGRYYVGLGSSRVRTKIPATRRLGQWVSLRKILLLCAIATFSQSRCLSLLQAVSGRIFLFFPPRGHEPPPTLRDRFNPDLSLQRHRFPVLNHSKHFSLKQYTDPPCIAY